MRWYTFCEDLAATIPDNWSTDHNDGRSSTDFWNTGDRRLLILSVARVKEHDNIWKTGDKMILINIYQYT